MAQQVKNLPTMARDTGSIPGLGKSPGGGKWQSTPVFLPKKSCGQRSLAGCSPEGRKESDTDERLSMHRGELELDKQRSSVQFISVKFSHSVVSDSLRPRGLCMPDFPIYHQLSEPTQTHVHCVSDVIQPSHPLI